MQGSPVGDPAVMTLPCPGYAYDIESIVEAKHSIFFVAKKPTARCVEVKSLHWGPRMVCLLTRRPARRAERLRSAGLLKLMFQLTFNLNPSWDAQGRSAGLTQVCSLLAHICLLRRAGCWRTTGQPPCATNSTAWRACARARPAWRWTPAGACCVCSARTPARRAEPCSQGPAETRCEFACTAPARRVTRLGASCACTAQDAVPKSGAVQPGTRED